MLLVDEICTMEHIVLAGGCFWCTEAVFQNVRGVNKVISGYTGGHIKNPAYREVCSGKTGHAEGILIEFDPKEVPVKVLLEIFFATHDPTTLNRQGNDVGTQYRSAIYYTTEQQKQAAMDLMEHLGQERVFGAPIVTELEPLGDFYEAEAVHQDYYNQHRDQPYCAVIINPKVRKLKAVYAQYLKDPA